MLEGGKEKLLEGWDFGRVPTRNVLDDGSDRFEKVVAESGVLGVLRYLSQDNAQLLDHELVEGSDILLQLRQDSHDALHSIFVLVAVVVLAGLLLPLQHLKGVLEDGGHTFFVLVPDTEGLVRVACGKVFLDCHSRVGVDDVTLGGDHFGEALKEGRVQVEGNDKTEGSGKLQGISLQNGVPGRERL